MSEHNTDRLIERYLSGSMGPSEEAEFMSRVQSEPELSSLLSAEQLVRSAVANDRAAIASVQPELLERFTNMLNAQAVPSNAASATTQRQESGRKKYYLLLGLLLLLLVSVGTWVATSGPETASQLNVPAQPTTPASGDVRTSQPVAPAATTPEPGTVVADRQTITNPRAPKPQLRGSKKSAPTESRDSDSKEGDRNTIADSKLKEDAAKSTDPTSSVPYIKAKKVTAPVSQGGDQSK